MVLLADIWWDGMGICEPSLLIVLTKIVDILDHNNEAWESGQNPITNAESPEFEFYKLCIFDNLNIFEFKGDDNIKIPEMSFDDLENIYKLTVEHLRYAGYEAKSVILRLLNDIISNIYYLTCPQVKKGLSTSVYKGRRKPVANSNS